MSQNNRIDVSVIVPIYNVETYLERCLSSLKCQTLKSFQILMIDDGSDDGSADIAKSFAEADSRFEYFCIPRGGVANARNVGLEHTQGEYIAFVDSDDYVSQVYLEHLYKAAVDNNCEISTCNYALVYDDHSGKTKPVKIRKLKSGVYSGEYYTQHAIRDWDVRSYLWNKLWHRSLFFDSDITFPKMYFEDIATVSRLTFNSNRVAVVDEVLYYYVVRKNSIMNSVKVEKINDYILAFGILRNYIQNQGAYRKYAFSLFRLACIVFFANHYNIFQLHTACRNMRGLIKNQYISNKNISYFAGRNFTAVQGYPKMPEYVFGPEDKSGKSLD